MYIIFERKIKDVIEKNSLTGTNLDNLKYSYKQLMVSHKYILNYDKIKVIQKAYIA